MDKKFYYMILIIIIITIFFINCCMINKHSKISEIITIDDISQLNETIVDKIICVSSIEEISSIIKSAKINNKKISIRGTAHTMGGHTITPNGYVLDMKFMDKIISLDLEKKIINVQAGVTWDKIIKYLNQYQLSPETLQSYATFSVGGSISANIHGITTDHPLCNSLISITIVNKDGDTEIHTQKSELFKYIVGGYGLFGVIVEAQIKCVDNIPLFWNTECINVNDFPKKYNVILNDHDINVKLARLNIINFDTIIVHLFKKNGDKKVSALKSKPNEMSIISKILYKWILPISFVQQLRFFYEEENNTAIDINYDDKQIDRNVLLYESAESLGLLYDKFIDLKKSHILQEFFVPYQQFNSWILSVKKIFSSIQFNRVKLLNITIRYIEKDSISFLNYASENMFCFVFYYRIDRSIDADNELYMIHNYLTQASLNLNGTFYLPYRHHYTKQQLIKAYPQIYAFINKKMDYDICEIFCNLWYDNCKKILEYGPIISTKYRNII
jgi:hypothetical protein